MTDYDGDEVAKVRIHENDDPRRNFSIGSSGFGDAEEEILYLRLPTEDVRRLRDWANEHLAERLGEVADVDDDREGQEVGQA